MKEISYKVEDCSGFRKSLAILKKENEKVGSGLIPRLQKLVRTLKQYEDEAVKTNRKVNKILKG
jgi:hypothetical protein